MLQERFLSEKMCRLLSSLAPGFEGHWWWVNAGIKIRVFCETDYQEEVGRCGRMQAGSYNTPPRIKICPAWQVEDVLRNLHSLFNNQAFKPDIKIDLSTVSEKISWLLVTIKPEFVYQKIEEYLWTVLK